jgi:hypothetical protein
MLPRTHTAIPKLNRSPKSWKSPIQLFPTQPTTNKTNAQTSTTDSMKRLTEEWEQKR